MIKFTAPEDRVVRTPWNRVTEKVTDMEQQILMFLMEDPAYTYMALSEKTGVSRKTVSSRIKSLKDKGVIQRGGSDTKGYWKIKEI